MILARVLPPAHLERFMRASSLARCLDCHSRLRVHTASKGDNCRVMRSYSVVVITVDSESTNPGSSPGRSVHFRF
jgi:hypothetical protein